jgi:Tol biopolymer transport system component
MPRHDHRPTPISNRVFAGIAGATLLLAILPTFVSATTPGQNGPIAFRRFGDVDQTNSALFVVNPDGTHETQITFPGDNVVDAMGNWSPDGARIAFTRTTSCGDDCVTDELYVMNADGSNVHSIATTTPTIESPAWSPDGRWIAFAMATDPGDGGVQVAIWELHPDGSGLRQVTHPIAGQSYDHAVQFSPDGSRIVIVRELASCGCPGIFTADAANGAHVTRVSPPGLKGFDHPDWSPDGRWVVFRTEARAGGSSGVFVAHPDGSHVQPILVGSRTGRQFRSSTFSPDGTELVISIIPGPDANADLWIGRFDASEHLGSLTQLTHTDAFESSVRWGNAPLLR